VYFFIFLTNQNEIYIISQGDSTRTRRTKGETPKSIYKVKVPSRAPTNRQNKLHVNTHTQKRMFPPVMVTII